MFLPISKQDMISRNWDSCDFVLVSGDAYIDHPSFGVAIISRLLELHGYKVCILAQPNLNDKESFKQFGTPRLGFLVTSGNIDSMVNHYTVSKRKRKKDYYTENGVMGKRPDRAVIKYSRRIRELYNNTPIILGGIEASLRKLSHYDYWDNSVRRSILLDSQADLICYGMAETSIIEVADYLNSGLSINELSFIKGTVFKSKDLTIVDEDNIILPSYDEVLEDKSLYNKSFKIQYQNTDSLISKTLIEQYRNTNVIVNPPCLPLSREELDRVYDLPYQRKVHPIYKKGVPAIEEVQFSIISNRGCFGSCSFCALTAHQGRTIQSRSKESILKEANHIVSQENFKGYIHDVGGPTANFYNVSCQKQLTKGVCKTKECLDPEPCNQLEVSHEEYLDILKELRNIENVKKVFVRSGIRYDYLMYDKSDKFFNELVKNHISGQLKVAPEHISENVLKYMGKPRRKLYDSFVKKYYELNAKYNKNQFLVPYLMSSHPGSTLKEAIELAEYIRDLKYYPEQVQDFYPTPGSRSTAMYYTGYDPITNDKVYVPRTKEEKSMQRALLQYKDPKNHDLVRKALHKANRLDLIGNKPKCLLRK